jgi:hypothetical protein
MNRARALMLALALPAMVLVSSPPGVAFATTVRRVAITGADTGDCSVTACRTIGYAISQSVSGDTIEIGAGTYPEHVVVDRSITLQGAGAGATIVDGSNRRTVIAIGALSDSLHGQGDRARHRQRQGPPVAGSPAFRGPDNRTP